MKAKGWVVVRARRKTYGQHLPNGKMPVGEVSLMPGLWKNKPTVEEDQEAIEIEIDFPADYFDHSSPKIEVVVPSAPAATQIVQTTAKVRAGRAPSAAASVVKP